MSQVLMLVKFVSAKRHFALEHTLQRSPLSTLLQHLPQAQFSSDSHMHYNTQETAPRSKLTSRRRGNFTIHDIRGLRQRPEGIRGKKSISEQKQQQKQPASVLGTNQKVQVSA